MRIGDDRFRRSLVAAATVALIAGCGSDNDDDDDPAPEPPPPVVSCSFDRSVPLSHEEQRLGNRLPGVSEPFSKQILEASGFERFEPEFEAALCTDGIAGAGNFEEGIELVKAQGQALWRAAVDRVQGRATVGTLPRSDDRMLYWARLTMTRSLRQWQPSFEMTEEQREELQWQFERASRGQYDIDLPEGDQYKRIIVSGFDPFTLGDPGATDNVNIRIGNPSGASALAYDGHEFPMPDGTTGRIETYVLPVSYPPFQKGMQEDTLGPWFEEGPRQVDASITMSQGGGYQFKLEQWNARYHGGREGNDGVVACPAPGSEDRLPATGECDIFPPARWLGYEARPWKRDYPPQFTSATLPVAEMILANTGLQVPRPPDSLALGPGAFDVVWGYNYDVFPDCNAPETERVNTPVLVEFPPPTLPVPPQPGACSRRGGGGDYLSNESAYRNTLMRDLFQLTIPAGHIHTPVMTRFQEGNDSAITDPKFEAYRDSIVAQGLLLVKIAAAGDAR